MGDSPQARYLNPVRMTGYASPLERRLAAGSVASFVSLLLVIGTAIVQVPVLLRAWGEEQYGAWLLVNATYSLIISLDLGHQNFVGNKLSMLGLASVPECRRILGSAVKAAWVIGLIEIAVAAAVVGSGLFTIWLPGATLAIKQLRLDASLALLVQTTFFALVGSVLGILVRVYTAGGLYARSTWIGVTHRGAVFVALMAGASLGWSMTSAACAQIAVWSIVCIFEIHDLRRRFPCYWPWWREGSLLTGLRQAATSLSLTVTSVSDQFAASGLLGVSGYRLHGTGVATLGTMRTLANSILQAAGVIVLPMQPDLSRYSASGDHEKTSATLAALWLFTTTPLCLALTFFLPTVEAVFGWWTRNSLQFSGSLFSFLALSTLVRQWQSPMAVLLFSANRLRAQAVISVARTIALFSTLAVGFWWSRNIEIAGAAVLTAELISSTICSLCSRSFLREMGGDLPVRAMQASAVQIGIAALGMYFLNSRAEQIPNLIWCCLGAHLVVAIAQWALLPIEVRRRMLALVR